VLKLFEMLKNKKVSLSLNELANRTTMSKEECSNILNGLLNKGVITISEEKINGKMKEVFNLDDFIKQIEEFFESKIRLEKTKENESQTKKNIGLVEETFGRPLTPLELQFVNDWTISGEAEENIRKALAKAYSAKKLNIRYVDQCLVRLSETKDEPILDEKTSKILEDIYRKI